MTPIRPSAGFGSIRTRPNGFNRGPVNGVELPGGAQRDRLGTDLKDADLSGQHLDCWIASAAHKWIVIGKAGKKPRGGPALSTVCAGTATYLRSKPSRTSQRASATVCVSPGGRCGCRLCQIRGDGVVGVAVKAVAEVVVAAGGPGVFVPGVVLDLAEGGAGVPRSSGCQPIGEQPDTPSASARHGTGCTWRITRDEWLNAK
jgi:hypothetical protein